MKQPFNAGKWLIALPLKQIWYMKNGWVIHGTPLFPSAPNTFSGGIFWSLKTCPKYTRKEGSTGALGINPFSTLSIGDAFNYCIFYFHPEPWGRWTHFDSYFSDGWFNHQLPGTPRPTIYKWMEMVISNHFLYKDLVHHPIETSIYKWLFRVPGSYKWLVSGHHAHSQNTLQAETGPETWVLFVQRVPRHREHREPREVFFPPQVHRWPKIKPLRFDGSEIRQTYQLRLVVYPIVYRVWDTFQVVVWDFWTINSISGG